MQRKTTLLAICFFLASFLGHTQSVSKFFFGLGMGLDYGGVGLKAEVQPHPNIGLFAGGGYNLLDPAYNFGASFKLLPNRKVQPFITGMYGYNAVLKIKNIYGNVIPEMSGTYKGFTAGAGVDLFDSRQKNKLTLEILVPFRSKEFTDYYQSLKDAGYEFKPGILPITFTVGYNFSIGRSTNTGTK